VREHRWHVGASIRRLLPDEPRPVLFRDLGPAATVTFLQGRLRCLSGRSPVVYLRTSDWTEPYVDHEAIGRLVVLRPDVIEPWATGLAHVYVASVHHLPCSEHLGFVPGEVPLAQAASELAGVRQPAVLREIFGGKIYDEALQHTLHRLQDLCGELQRAERLAEPLRRALQSGGEARQRALSTMERMELTEQDLCAAWHHLPRDRRGHLLEVLHAG
jgi:hypothetical protein